MEREPFHLDCVAEDTGDSSTIHTRLIARELPGRQPIEVFRRDWVARSNAALQGGAVATGDDEFDRRIVVRTKARAAEPLRSPARGLGTPPAGMRSRKDAEVPREKRLRP